MTLVPERPGPEDFEAWLRTEVEETTARKLQELIDTDQARWIRDPEVWTVFAIELKGETGYGRDPNVLLVMYDNGADFELGEAGEELYCG